MGVSSLCIQYAAILAILLILDYDDEFGSDDGNLPGLEASLNGSQSTASPQLEGDSLFERDSSPVREAEQKVRNRLGLDASQSDQTTDTASVRRSPPGSRSQPSNSSQRRTTSLKRPLEASNTLTPRRFKKHRNRDSQDLLDLDSITTKEYDIQTKKYDLEEKRLDHEKGESARRYELERERLRLQKEEMDNRTRLEEKRLNGDAERNATQSKIMTELLETVRMVVGQRKAE